MFSVLLVVFLVLFARNNFDMQGVKKDARKIVRGIRKILKDLGRTIRDAAQEGKQKAAESRQADPAQADAVQADVGNSVPAATAEPAEAEENRELLKEMEQKSGTAAMLANVPTIDFPADDPKYDSARKYLYA